jgi:hypothetical protein
MKQIPETNVRMGHLQAIVGAQTLDMSGYGTHGSGMQLNVSM